MRFARFDTPGDKNGPNMAINLDQVASVEARKILKESDDPDVLEIVEAARINFNMVSGQVLTVSFSSMELAKRVLRKITDESGMRFNTTPKERQKD